MGERLRVISYGGGVQSTALLVLAARAAIDFPVALFANVGDDAEHPATLRYVREVAAPYAAAHGIALHELRRIRRDGRTESLTERLVRSQRSITIPARVAVTGGFMRRNCTVDFKIRVISRWLREHGATKHAPAAVALGISLDEARRARTQSREPLQALCYPLLDRRLDRDGCAALIRGAGLPVPPKSSCYYCPFHAAEAWRALRRGEPALFARAAALERLLGDRAQELQGHRVYLSRALAPLQEAFGADGQLPLAGDGQIEPGAPACGQA